MYCHFCGKKILHNAKFCGGCGQQLRDFMEDTQPIPIITETVLRSSVYQTHIPWYKAIIPKKPVTRRKKVWQISYDLFSLAIVTTLLYILVTFKTVWEYQMLTSLWGGTLLFFLWWKR